MIPLKFAISSHVGNPSAFTENLLESLRTSGVKSKDIVVVCGGAKSEESVLKNGVDHRYVTHNSYDHTSIVYLVESGAEHPWWWVMHDTTEAGPDFLKRIQARGATHPHIALMREGWMNQGLFSIEFLQEIRHYVLRLKNCSKLRAILSERVYPRLTMSAYYEEEPVLLDRRDVYGDGDIRSAIHFPSIDFVKYQKHFIDSMMTRSFLNSQQIERHVSGRRFV